MPNAANHYATPPTRVKWRHRICGHDTIAILSVGRIKGRSFIVLFKLPSIRWFMKISVWSLDRRQSVFQRYHSEKCLSQFYSQGGCERQLASKVRHCHPVYTHAGCLQLSHVRTADPSADGRRSAASRTAIVGGHIVSPSPGRYVVSMCCESVACYTANPQRIEVTEFDCLNLFGGQRLNGAELQSFDSCTLIATTFPLV